MLRRSLGYWNTGKRGGVASSYILDLYGSAQIAYSVRKLSASYMGFCMRVRRNTDNATLDVGFVGDNLDTTSISSFIGGNTGYVQIWYDQSGNGRDSDKISTDSETLEPFIVNTGVLSEINSIPAVHFKNSSRMEFPSITPLSIFTVYNREGARITEYAIGASSGNGLITGGTGGTITGFGFVTANTLRVQNTVEDFNQHQGTYIGGSTEQVWTDGANNVTAGASYSDIALDTLGRRDNLSLSYWGWWQEIIMYATEKTTDRSNIEANQKAYFGTP